MLNENARILVKDSNYWLDPRGNFHNVDLESHRKWAQRYADERGITIPFHYDRFENHHLMDLGFIRIKMVEEMMIIEYSSSHPPTPLQWRVIKDSAIESSVLILRDETRNRNVPLHESILEEDKSNKELFIESMMPEDMDTFKSHLAQLFSYLKDELQLKTVPKVKLLSDDKNAAKVLGKTAYYDPPSRTVCLYTTNRHQKDILRSFAHEVIHHWQHENEKLQTTSKGASGHSTGKNEELHGRNLRRGMEKDDPQYAQNDPWLRQMEKQAYLLGNILFRDWEDEKKEKDRKSDKKMVELHGRGNVRYDSHTPIMKKKYHKSHAYRRGVEGSFPKGESPDPNNIEERTYVIGKEYPPKKMDYSG